MKIKYILIILILASFSFASICSAETENEENSEEKTASATRNVLTFNMGDGLPLEMIECPAGDFIMGCPDEEIVQYFISNVMITNQELYKKEYGIGYNEKPHKVTISKPFYIGKYEVTQSQYEYIMGKKEYEFIMEDKDKIRGPNKPMEWVDYILIVSGRQEFDDRFYDAEKGELKKNPSKIESFLEKINTKLAGQLPSGYKFDLPTEAQWEYACKAGTGKSFVNNIDEVAWYVANPNPDSDKNKGDLKYCEAQDVGQKKPNAWGIYDMLGNIAELCKDFYADYPTEAVTDPKNEFKISFKMIPDNTGICTEFDHPWCVARGGTYNSPASTCRSTTRITKSPRVNVFSHDIGFRLALVPVSGAPATSSSSTTSNSNNTTKVSDTNNSSSSSQPQTKTQKNYDSREYEPVKLKPYKTHPNATVPEDVELEPNF